MATRPRKSRTPRKRAPGGPPRPDAIGARYRLLEHPADIGFAAYGSTLPKLFENAAQALLELSFDLDAVAEKESRVFRVEGGEAETLLYNWLSEIHSYGEAERFVFKRVEVTRLSNNQIHGIGHGEPLDKSRHRAHTHIKAVTYHQFAVKQTDTGWEATVYVDL